MSESTADILVRPAVERDYPAIARLQQASPEAAQWPVGDYSNFQVLLALISRGSGPVVAGFCAWRQSSPEEAELLNLAVDPSTRRRGVATALLEALSATAAGVLFLEVAQSNVAAIALYEQHGWVRKGLRKGYYENGRVNAIVMQKVA